MTENKPLKFCSTNLKAPVVTFREALLKGIAPDRGLYMPEFIPAVSRDELESFAGMNYPQIANVIIGKYLKGEIDEDVLEMLIHDAYNFNLPLEHVTGRKYIMRLDQGPTASFKDFAARMMGRLMNHYLGKSKQKLLILTATSGDTGSAIANAFYGLDNIGVVVLFPENEVTLRQRKQMTTLGKNIQIISMDGKFDDCQALVKEAFADPALFHLNLSSANSINIGRLIPQSVYYFYAQAQLRKQVDEEVVFSVPSGNFGDMMGGVLAMNMGLPVKKFVIATNANDVFPKYLASGKYEKIVPSRNCISSAMNVGHPSNMARLVALYGGAMDETGYISRNADMLKLKRDIFAVSVDDDQTRESIRQAWNTYKLLLEPHGAVGWKGLTSYLDSHPEDHTRLCVSLETAHPAKFPEEIVRILGFDPPLPDSLQSIENLDEKYDQLEATYSHFKDYLISRF